MNQSNLTESALMLLFAMTFIALILWISDPFEIKSKKTLKKWSQENGLIILKAKRRSISKGPFTFTFGFQIVYRIWVEGDKTGWILMAMTGNKVSRVSWDK